MSLEATLLGLEQLELEDERYAFAAGSVRAREPRLLDEAALARLTDAESAGEVWQILREAGFERLGDFPPERYEEALAPELQDLYAYLRSVEPDGEQSVADWLASRYDFHNLKVALKAHTLGEAPEGAGIEGIGTVPPKLIETAVRTGVWEALPPELAEAGQAALEAYERTWQPQALDFAVDRAMLFQLKVMAFHPFLRALAETWCDLANVKIALRARALGLERSELEQVLVEPGVIDHERLLALREQPLEAWPEALPDGYGTLVAQSIGEEGWDPARFEVLCDDFVMEHLQAARYVSYGPQPVVAYGLARELELKNIRMIMVGKLYELSREELRTRLRRSYAQV